MEVNINYLGYENNTIRIRLFSDRDLRLTVCRIALIDLDGKPDKDVHFPVQRATFRDHYYDLSFFVNKDKKHSAIQFTLRDTETFEEKNVRLDFLRS